MIMFLRQALVNDFERIHKLSSQLGYGYPTFQLKKNLKEIMTLKDHRIYVIENENNEVVGYVHGQIYYLLFFDRLVDILGIVVEQNYRRKGYGKMLMGKIEKWAKENNCRGIRFTSNVKRKEAHLFYKTIGFMNRKESKCFIKIF